MNILVLNWRDIKNPDAGGSEKHMHELSKRLVAQGHNVTLMCAGFAGCDKVEILDGVKIVRVGNRLSIYLKVVRYLLSSNGSAYDVIYESINTVPFFAPLFSTCPVVAQIYSIDNRKALVDELKLYTFPLLIVAYAASYLIPRVYSKHEVVTISEASKRRLVEEGFNDKSVVVANPGLSEDYLNLVKGRRSVNRPNSTIVYLGRLKKYKGVQDILRALTLIKERIPSIQLLIVGKGDFEQELKMIAKTLHLEEQVKFCGFVSEKEKAELLLSSSLYVCTSSDEGGWTIAAIEAMAAGVPALVTESQIDVLNDGLNGLLLESQTPELIAEKICHCLLNPPLWKELSDNALHFSQLYNWDNTAKNTWVALSRAASTD